MGCHRLTFGTIVYNSQNIPAYKKYVDTFHEKINHVNQSYQGKLGYAPIVLTGAVFEPEKSDLFAAYDVFIITALADGMNLTPMEVVSAKHLDDEHDHHPAVFVLSEGAGIGRREGFAKHGYTLDRTMEPEMMKGQLKRAIDEVIATRENPEKMEELVAGNKSMQAFVRENEVNKWAADFLEQLLKPQPEETRPEFEDPAFDTSDEFPSSGSARSDAGKSGVDRRAASPYSFNRSDETSTAALGARLLMPHHRNLWSGAHPQGGHGYRQNPMPTAGRNMHAMWLRAYGGLRRLGNFPRL